MKLKVVMGMMLTLLMLSMVIVLAGEASLPLAIAQANSTTTVYLDPPTINGTAIGVDNTVTVNLMIRDAVDIASWQAGMIFNATLLECTGFEEGEFLKSEGLTYFFKGNINNTAGMIRPPYSCIFIGDYWASGDGKLAYLTFKVKAPGVSDIHLSDVKALDYELKLVPVNIIDVYTVVLDTTSHTVVTVSNSTDTVGGVLSGLYGHSFVDETFKELSFNVTGPHPGFSNVTIPKTLLPPPEPPYTWAIIVNGIAVGIEERIVTEDATHTSIYFTYPADINNVQITTRFMLSTISIALSEESISLGESVTISGTIDPVRPYVTVTIHNRTRPRAWDTLATVETNPNSEYTYTWKLGKEGTYEVMASWEGDLETLRDDSGVKTLEVTKESSTISIALSSTNITRGEPVIISGAIDPLKPGVTVTILYRPSGGTWTTLATVTTDANSHYSYTWTPETAGTYEVMASWEGDENTYGDESDMDILTVQEAPAAISLVPNTGFVSTTIVGSGFAAYSTVTATWDGTPTPTVPSPLITNSYGNFTALISVLSPNESGVHTVKATDEEGNWAEANFTVTLGIDTLLSQYAHLNSSYYDLKSKHEALMGDLNTIRNLNYIFIIATIIFIATTVYLATRKPKVKPELKAT